MPPDRPGPTTLPLPTRSETTSPVSSKSETELGAAPVGGVYVLLLGDCIVYVGQSADIRERLRTHRKEGVKKFDSAVFYPVDDPTDRLRTEGILILQHLPIHNAALLLRISHGRVSEIRFSHKRRGSRR